MDVNHTIIIKDAELGTGLATSVDLESGDVILRITNPFLTIVENATLDRVCSQCLFGYEAEELKKCTGCKIVRYCSKKCQEISWKSIHKKECTIFKGRGADKIIPTTTRAVIQTLLRHQYGASLDPIWAALVSQRESQEKQPVWESIILQAQSSIMWTQKPREWINVAIELLCRVNMNAFRVTLFDNALAGLCFDPLLARVNHSCDPNAAVIFNGRHASLRALLPIKQGSQIFISYIDPTSQYSVRQEQLKRAYCFDCKCPKCRYDERAWKERKYQGFATAPNFSPEDPRDRVFNRVESKCRFENEASPPYRLIEQRLQDTQGLLTDYQARKNNLSMESRIQVLKKAQGIWALLRKYNMHCIQPYPSVLEEFYLAYLDMNAYLPALIVNLFLCFQCDPYLYVSHYHPTRVLRLFTLSRLLKAVAAEDPALLATSLPFIPEDTITKIDYVSAVQIVLMLVGERVPKSHGQETRFMEVVRQDIGEIEGVQRMRGAVGEVLGMWFKEGKGEGKELVDKIWKELEALGEWVFGVIADYNKEN
ncbi:hypothetical protein B7494_g2119 [Chlorociboria aeruginascens]|nr:hypothetical protein B7494_g2119 [Chlorociboria aeruginascens]